MEVNVQDDSESLDGVNMFELYNEKLAFLQGIDLKKADATVNLKFNDKHSRSVPKMNECDQLVRDEQYHIHIRRTMEMFLTSVEEEAAGTKSVTMARVIQLWKAAAKETIRASAKSPNLWLNFLYTRPCH
jgi:L-rhamnose mutarotase